MCFCIAVITHAGLQSHNDVMVINILSCCDFVERYDKSLLPIKLLDVAYMIVYLNRQHFSGSYLLRHIRRDAFSLFYPAYMCDSTSSLLPAAPLGPTPLQPTSFYGSRPGTKDYSQSHSFLDR